MVWNYYWKLELRLFEGKYSLVSKEDSRTIVLIILLLQRYHLMHTIVGYFHFPVALSHSLSTVFQLYTWTGRNAMRGCIFNCCKSEFQWYFLKMAHTWDQTQCKLTHWYQWHLPLHQLANELMLIWKKRSRMITHQFSTFCFFLWSSLLNSSQMLNLHVVSTFYLW